MSALRFIATTLGGSRIVVEMTPAGWEYAVRLNGQRMLSLYETEEDVRRLVEFRERGLASWEAAS